MPHRRERDPEAMRRALDALSMCLVVLGMGAAAYAGWQLLRDDPRRDEVGLLVLGVGCLALSVILRRSALDDGTGEWCPVCVTRNPEGAELCGACGSRISGHWT